MRRKGINIMAGLIKLLSPMLHIMLACIGLGSLGFLAAIFIPILATNFLLEFANMQFWNFEIRFTVMAMIIMAIIRAIFRYGEQTCGHYIAFKLLASIRDKVFSALRKLAPAKLENKGRGNLIAIITGDIELLEVFYAHTIAPIYIAIIVSTFMTMIIGNLNFYLGLLALIAYIIIGILLPIISSKIGNQIGMEARKQLGNLNNIFLESLRGIKEILQYGQENSKNKEIEQKTKELNKLQAGIKIHESIISSWSTALVMGFPIINMFLGIILNLDFPIVIMSTVMLASSYGPVLALANLSPAMDSTLAAGERVLSLLEENPETPDIVNGQKPIFDGAKIENLNFSYDRQLILKDLSIEFAKGKIISLVGKSGSGKSTLLKLLMRFWKADDNAIKISNTSLEKIDTAYLRSLESFMTQETDLFNVSIKENIRIGKLDASDQEIIEACKKASIHDFIVTLPKGYDSIVGELGESLSGGERQRIGLARALLHDAPLLILDEPTSSLDSLNEGIILKSILEENKNSNRTVVIVSHRKSTLAIADSSYKIESGRLS